MGKDFCKRAAAFLLLALLFSPACAFDQTPDDDAKKAAVADDKKPAADAKKSATDEDKNPDKGFFDGWHFTTIAVIFILVSAIISLIDSISKYLRKREKKTIKIQIDEKTIEVPLNASNDAITAIVQRLIDESRKS